MRPNLLSAVAPVVVAGIVLSACGQATTPVGSKTSASNPTRSFARGPGGGQFLVGTVAAVSGDTLQTRNPASGQTAVTIGSSTVITEFVAATQSDIAPGDCVVATGTLGSGGVLAASSVRISPASTTCQGPRPGFARPGRRIARHRPTKTFNRHSVSGKVKSVSGTTMVVSTSATTKHSVSLSTSTSYLKATTAPPSAIVVGDCITAIGHANQIGTVAATRIQVSPANHGSCGGGFGRPGGRFGG